MLYLSLYLCVSLCKSGNFLLCRALLRVCLSFVSFISVLVSCEAMCCATHVGLYLLYCFLVLAQLFVAGFKLQATILQTLFHAVESNAVTIPLWDTAAVQDPTMTNQKFLREYVMNLLSSAFPNLTP